MSTLSFLAILQESGDWRAAGHAIRGEWLVLLGRIGLWVSLALYTALVARALVRGARQRKARALAPDDLAAIHAELVAAERKTVGEILPVVLERSDEHAGARWLAALTFLLLGSGVLALTSLWHVPWLVLLLQLACGALGWATARLLPDFQRLFVREAHASAAAEEQAFQEFHLHGLHETQAKTGVLVFVSLFERRAIVLGDSGIDARVSEEHWRTTTERILAGIAAGSLRDGLVEGIRSCGEVLALHFPWTAGDRNEVPDRLIVRRE